MGKFVRTLVITFDTPIRHQEIPLFRGAVLKCLGNQADILYHNHTGEGSLRYSYPLIQYKQIRGKAAIVCVEEAIDTIVPLLTGLSGKITLGRRETECVINHINSSKEMVQIDDHFKTYRLLNWLPLNSKNYIEYQNLESLLPRVQMLERVLIGNLLSFLKGVGIHVDEQFKVLITDILGQRAATYKGVQLMTFDVEFKTNLTLPQDIGLGKNVSVGYGTLTRITS